MAIEIKKDLGQGAGRCCRRCREARGDRCACSCGGAFHGRDAMGTAGNAERDEMVRHGEPHRQVGGIMFRGRHAGQLGLDF